MISKVVLPTGGSSSQPRLQPQLPPAGISASVPSILPLILLLNRLILLPNPLILLLNHLTMLLNRLILLLQQKFNFVLHSPSSRHKKYWGTQAQPSVLK